MMISGSTQVKLEGVGKVTLTPNDHLGTGGEGSAYRKSDRVIKLYTDTAKMKRDGMPEKLKMLSKIDHPYIVGPKGLVLDGHDHPLGYWMDFVEGEPLPPLCTNDFRQRERFTDKHTAILVDRMREVVETAHQHQAVMVDANLLNWVAILNKGLRKGPEPRAIDVDSWAIDRWPAKVIMASVRDWHTKGFTTLSDWFTWACVTWEILVGIHPYRGGLDGYTPQDMEVRMKKNLSVFTPGVRLNRAVRDFSVVPQRWLPWYEAVFQKGERSAPPSLKDPGITPAIKAAVVSRMVSMATGMLVYNKLFEEHGDRAVRVFPCGAVLLESGKLYDLNTKRYVGTAKSLQCEVVEVKGYWILADWDGGSMHFSCIDQSNLKEHESQLPLQGHKLIRYENRLFVVVDDGLAEVELTVIGKPILSVGKTWGVLTNSTRWFDGVGIQDAMGSTFVVAPFGSDSCTQTRVKELDGMKPVAAKAGNRFVSVIGLDRNGQYRKIELAFDKDYAGYQVWQGGADGPELNMAIKPNGVVATIVEDTKLVIFVPNGKVTKVDDRDITTNMALFTWGDQVVYILNGAVWTVTMSKKP